MTSEDEFVSSSWMPRFKFVQSSHYAAETSVNGETELVHWIVKDRPFSIRVVELPTAPVSQTDENPAEETEFLWNDVEVKADVVYKSSKSPVKTSTGQAPLAVDSSVVPPHAYNHRRNAVHISADSDAAVHNAVLKLKEGAGLDLSARLAILSSHLRNDFCIHVQLYLQGHRVASWYSPTIKTVSKWDKVRLLQESSFLPSSSYAATRTRAAHPTTTTTTTTSTSHSHTRTTQTDVVAPVRHHHTSTMRTAISRALSARSATTPSAASSRSSTRRSATAFASAHQATQMPVSSTMPKVQIEDSETHPAEGPHHTADADFSSSLPCDSLHPTHSSAASHYLQHESPAAAPAAANTAKPSSSAAAHARSAANAKKKGSGEEVFDMLAQIRRVASDLTQLASKAATTQAAQSKKRKAHWDPSIDAYPSELEAAVYASSQLHRSSSSASFISSSSYNTTPRASSSATMVKKAKTKEVSSTEVHHVDALSQAPAPARFAAYARQFLHMLDTMPLGEVREALKSLLLSRPDLSSSLALLMNPNTNKVVEPACAASDCASAENATFEMNSKASGTSDAACHQACCSVQVTPHTQTPAQEESPEEAAAQANLTWTDPSLTSSFGFSLGQSAQFWPSNDRYGMEVYQSSLGASNMEGQEGTELNLAFSPSAAVLDDESTTMGSPNSYSSWTETGDWSADQFSADSESHFDQDSMHSFFPVLTASAALTAGSPTILAGILP